MKRALRLFLYAIGAWVSIFLVAVATSIVAGMIPSPSPDYPQECEAPVEVDGKKRLTECKFSVKWEDYSREKKGETYWQFVCPQDETIMTYGFRCCYGAWVYQDGDDWKSQAFNQCEALVRNAGQYPEEGFTLYELWRHGKFKIKLCHDSDDSTCKNTVFWSREGHPRSEPESEYYYGWGKGFGQIETIEEPTTYTY